jgi:hypothetical protein
MRKNGIVIYPYDDMAKVEAILQEHEIQYTVEILDYEQHKPKAQGVKYASRSECIKHLLDNDEPESQVVPNLRKKLEEKEERIKLLEINHVAEKTRNDNMEARLLKFEEKLSKGGL